MVIKTRRTPESERLSKAFGNRIAQLRIQNEWSQRELSERAEGMDRGFISRIESGQVEPCLGTQKMLAKAFGISLSALMRGIE